MNEQKTSTANGKQLKTQTTSSAAKAPEASPYDLLEPIEEKVIRMRFGLSEDDSKKLEYGVGASEDTKHRMTLMEAGNIADLEGNVPVAAGADREALNAYVQNIDFKDFG